jgi:hypothetical protein
MVRLYETAIYGEVKVAHWMPITNRDGMDDHMPVVHLNGQWWFQSPPKPKQNKEAVMGK